jgi:hypothetical protein
VSWTNLSRGPTYPTTVPCRICGRPAGQGRGDVIYSDFSRGEHLGEHKNCRSIRLQKTMSIRTPPSRDWLAPTPEWRLP